LHKNEAIKQKLQDKILPRVKKPGRYIGNELNSVHKDPVEIKTRIVLAFPEIYEIAMSYMGFDILYNVLNKEKDIWAERVYAPWPDMANLLRENDAPLYTLESFTPISECHIIAFTLQYELTYTNIIEMMDLAGLQPLAANRLEDDPLIIGGGPCTSNPEPTADFFDAFLIGDGEEAAVEICRVYSEAKNLHKSKKEILSELAKISGVYVPVFYNVEYNANLEFYKITPNAKNAPLPIYSRIVKELKADYYPRKPLAPLIDITHNRLSVEVMRGCTEGCRFCSAGMIYRPVRERTVDEIIAHLQNGLEETGYEEASFLSLSISDYSRLNELMRRERAEMANRKTNVSFPSMRLDNFSDEIAKFVSSVRKSGFTFAPEAATERLRRVINKNISEEDLMNSVEIALRNGWKLLKFYFMIGLPTERKEDIEGISQLLKKVVDISRQYGKVRFNVSISPFSPKSHTPFQWERQNTIEELEQKIEQLKSGFQGLRQVKLSWRDARVSMIEGILGRGDRKMSGAILSAWNNGAVFDGWSEYFKFDTWLSAFESAQINIQHIQNEHFTNMPLPWDHIDKGVTKKFLLNEKNNAYNEITLPDCKDTNCLTCGIQRKNSFAEFAECYAKKKTESAVSDVKQQGNVNDGMNTNEVGETSNKKIRVQFSKQDVLRYLSHLDLLKIFERAFILAKIPVLYSEGFNPRPKISFGPSLGLGISSTAEYFDLEYASHFTLDIKDKLNSVLPAGLRVENWSELKSKPTSLSAHINAAEYQVDFSGASIDFSILEKAVQNLMQKDDYTLERRVKGKLKNVNIRPYIHSITLNKPILFVETKSIANRTVRMSEILKILLNSQAYNSYAHRTGQFIIENNQKRTPLEVI
jgi:radical SAM family uncharacterized protein/radical SAM-linked protein